MDHAECLHIFPKGKECLRPFGFEVGLHEVDRFETVITCRERGLR